MEPRLKPLTSVFELNADLVLNCAEGLTEAQANHRLEGGGNSVAFLIAHLTDARHFLANLLGSPLPNPVGDLLSDVRSIDEVHHLPTLTDLLDAWRTVSTHLSQQFERLEPTDLDRPVTQSFPIPGGTALEAIAFLAQHDSYHLGQIAFLRRQLGLPAMRYDRPGSRLSGKADG
jgi:uncharacterized damage-inducible protein DinB